MIHYSPLWETMSKQKATTYTLRQVHKISHSTVQRLQNNMPVSTYTLDRLCTIFHCQLKEVAEYISENQT